MKIGMVSPLAYPVPPERYGGIELVVYYLIEGLVKKGHEVTLFAPEGSKTSAKFDTKFTKPIIGGSLDAENLDYCQKRARYIAESSADFDIVHNHDGFLPMVESANMKCPLVSTWHVPLGRPEKMKPEWREMMLKENLVSISYSQRKPFPEANFVANVYNGTTDLEKYQFSEGGEYLIWFGRFDDYKGPREAIEVAKRTGHKIVLAGKADSDDQKKYFNDFIKPEIDNEKVIFLGQIGIEEKNKWLGKSKAFLMPIDWEEPFGLVMIEAMACGTPVIAFNRGSVSEIVKDGETGFIVEPGNVDKMVEAVGNLSSIDRRKCRESVEKDFSIERMVDSYEAVYQKLIEKH
ncbi:MAG: glycosyltransferase family 4 protein [Patescibacteria group bacterium]